MLPVPAEIAAVQTMGTEISDVVNEVVDKVVDEVVLVEDMSEVLVGVLAEVWALIAHIHMCVFDVNNNNRNYNSNNDKY